jgi:hypothetical protein
MSEASVKRAGASVGGRDDEPLVLPSEVGQAGCWHARVFRRQASNCTPRLLHRAACASSAPHLSASTPILTFPLPPPNRQVIALVDASEIQQVFLASARLDSDAVIAFVRALAAISQVRRPRGACGCALAKGCVGRPIHPPIRPLACLAPPHLPLTPPPPPPAPPNRTSCATCVPPVCSASPRSWR